MKSLNALKSLLDGVVSIEQRSWDRIAAIAAPAHGVDTIRMVMEMVAGRGLQRPSASFAKIGNVAIVGIYGVIVPDDDEDNEYFGLVSCNQIRSDLKCAMDDPDVSEIMLCISSPGGSVLGVDETAAAIRAAKAQKPITAFSNGMTCSAAYYLASQCNEICVSKDSINGSIGVFATLVDLTGLYQQYGVRVEVIRAGAMKGLGQPGTPITDEQRKERQRIVDSYYSLFVDAVAAGRGIPRDKALALADGRVYVGAETLAAGLADAVDTYDSALARLSGRAKSKTTMQARGLQTIKGEQAMTEAEKAAAQAETLTAERKRATDITAAFPEAPAFAIRMINENKSLIEAKAAYADELKAQNAEQAKKIAELQASATAGNKVGNKSIPTGSGAGAGDAGKGAENAKEEFVTKVDALVAKGIQRPIAVQRVAKSHPDLHRAMVAAANGNNAALLDQHESFAK